MAEGIKTRRGNSVGLIDTKTYLYKLGDECSGLTGGWGRNATLYGTVTKNAGDLYIEGTSAGGGVASLTENLIDLSNYTKLCIDASMNVYISSYSTSGFGVGSVDLNGVANNYSPEYGTYAYKNHVVGTYARQIIELDISSVTSGYPFISQASRTATPQNYMTLYNMWLE